MMKNRFLKFLLAVVLVVSPFVSSMAATTPVVDCSVPVASMYVKVPAEANSFAVFDGYVFINYHYANAANKWYDEIYKSPCGYKPRPPLYSISVDSTVSGTVNP